MDDGALKWIVKYPILPERSDKGARDRRIMRLIYYAALVVHGKL